MPESKMISKSSYKVLAISVLITIFVITLFLGYRASKLQFNYDFDDYLPQNDNDATYYQQYKETYGSENDFLILVIEKRGMYSPTFLQKIDSMSKELKENIDITKIITPTDLKQPVFNTFSFAELPLLHINDSHALKNDSINIYNSKEWVGSFFGTNRKSLLIYIEYTHQLQGNEAKNLINHIETTLQKHKIEHSYLTGRIVAEHVFITKMREELTLFISLSALLLIVFLWIAYRSLWGVLVPMSAVLCSIIWTCGIMQLTGYKLDILTVLLPSILFIITISDITHFLSKYLEELRAGTKKYTAFEIAFKEIGLATLITAVTTAIGFITFLNSQMLPIKYFGLYAALGVFVSYIVAFSYMPAIIILLPKPKVASVGTDKTFWFKHLHKLLMWVFRNHIKIIWGSVVICGMSVIGILNIEINSTIIDDISDKDQIKKAMRYTEENFGGVRPFELDIILSAQTDDVFSINTFRNVSQIHKYLEQKYQVSNIISPVSMICALNKAQHGASNDQFAIPTTETELVAQLKLLKKQQNRKELRSHLKDKGRRIRISGRMKDYGSKIFLEKDLAFSKFMDSLNTNKKLFQYHITGTATLVDKNNQQIAYDMILDLFIGVLTIGLIIGLLFRNAKMAVLAVIPNFAPLLLIAGIMGMASMDLKASNSIIFSIAFGIAIDDSIHFLSRLKEELNKGKNLFYALKTTYLSTGKAMLITSMIVVSGFCTMIFSDFGGTFYMGLLVSLTLVFAIAFDFLLLPALLINFFRKKGSHSSSDHP